MADPYNGIINVYKEQDFTSFDVVAKMRGIAGQRKIGHTGTLDPMATGVLPVCLGNATKACDLLTDWDKEYEAELLLGKITDTLDVTGEVLSEDPEGAMSLTEDQVRIAVSHYLGEILQVPPMYSALKVNGQRLYDLARKGVEVERKPRPVTIHELEILEMALPVVKLRVLCSKGTYIRTLCDDIGRELGCGGTMQSLVRTKVGPFTLDNAWKLVQLQALKDGGNLGDAVESVDSLFADLSGYRVLPGALKLLENGNKLQMEDLDGNSPVVLGSPLQDDQTDDSVVNSDAKVRKDQAVRIYRPDGSFAGIYRNTGREFKPEKMFL